ncbi:MAG: SOS response-associated peptidase [Flavobacteriaceae bacterium]|nr:SOS response-associated peptidase [Flavobacteriaceae bacterium]
MCYHTKQTKSATEVQNRFNASISQIEIFKPTQHFNAFDYPKMPVIASQNTSIIEMWNWGLIPQWSSNIEIRSKTLNARIETVHEKPAFSSYLDNRCIIIANGFYEWQWLDSKGKSKNKFEIGVGNDRLFAFAGLFAEWVNEDTGEILNTFTMLTTQANVLMSEIHNIKKRMPVILKPEDEQKWLQGAEIQEFAFPGYEVNLIAENLNPQLSLF